MTSPFTSEETKKAAKSLKNNKSPGIDNIHAEFLKYAPQILHEELANTYNEIDSTGNFLKN